MNLMEKFKKGALVVSCSYEEEVEELSKICEKENLRDASRMINYWRYCSGDVGFRYSDGILYSHMDFYYNNNYDIVECKKFINDYFYTASKAPATLTNILNENEINYPNAQLCELLYTIENNEKCGHNCKQCQYFTSTAADLLIQLKDGKETDWSEVPVDTPILVRDLKTEPWRKRYFCKFEKNRVYAYSNGATSWSSSDYTFWNYAKLASEEDL